MNLNKDISIPSKILKEINKLNVVWKKNCLSWKSIKKSKI
jgi:hypothetical protein